MIWIPLAALACQVWTLLPPDPSPVHQLEPAPSEPGQVADQVPGELDHLHLVEVKSDARGPPY